MDPREPRSPRTRGCWHRLRSARGHRAPANAGPDVERIYELVDRRGPLEELRQLWSEVTAGRGQVVVLEGEAGVGKSRLAYELRHGDATGASWLTVQCSPLASERPFGPLTAQLPAIDSSEGAVARGAPRGRPCRRCSVGTGSVRDRTSGPPHRGHPLGRSLNHGGDRALADALASEARPLLVLCTTRQGPDQGGWTGRGCGGSISPRWVITTCRSSSAPRPTTRCRLRRSRRSSSAPMVLRSTRNSWRDLVDAPHVGAVHAARDLDCSTRSTRPRAPTDTPTGISDRPGLRRRRVRELVDPNADLEARSPVSWRRTSWSDFPAVVTSFAMRSCRRQRTRR